jgi:hypothetical protein
MFCGNYYRCHRWSQKKKPNQLSIWREKKRKEEARPRREAMGGRREIETRPIRRALKQIQSNPSRFRAAGVHPGHYGMPSSPGRLRARGWRRPAASGVRRAWRWREAWRSTAEVGGSPCRRLLWEPRSEDGRRAQPPPPQHARGGGDLGRRRGQTSLGVTKLLPVWSCRRSRERCCSCECMAFAARSGLWSRVCWRWGALRPGQIQYRLQAEFRWSGAI